MEKEEFTKIEVVPAQWDIKISTSRSDFHFEGTEAEIKNMLKLDFDWRERTDFIEVVVSISCGGFNKWFNMKTSEKSLSTTRIHFEEYVSNSTALEGVFQQEALEFLLK